MGDAPQRLNKYLAHHLGLSRRQADDLIAAGRVAIDGQPARLGARLDGNQQLTIDGQAVDQTPRDYTYIALNKPVGYVCSRRSQGGDPTVYELLPAELHSLKAVGRLDRDSSGLLLLTDDGDFAYRMTHPKFHKTKSYQVTLDQPLQPLHRQMISDRGVNLDDGPSRLQLERLEEGDDSRWRVMMHEGRNRQIRRTFAALGYTVQDLHRTQFGPFDISGLSSGNHRSLQIDE